MTGIELLELVLERAASAGVDLRPIGDQAWRGDCVSCGGEDRWVARVDAAGRLFLKCYGQCTRAQIAAAIELTEDDLRQRREPPKGRMVYAADVRAEPVRWLIPGRVPLGAVSLLAGDPKLGKSTLSCLFAAGVTVGRYEHDPANVMIVSAEDSFARIIKPRAVAAGADVSKLAAFDVIDDEGPRNPDLPDDVAAITAMVAEHRVRLVVIDPLNAFLAGSVDSWKDHGVRRALAPLARMAEELDCTVLVVVHLNKQRGGDPLYRIGGSIGQVGAARSVLSFGRDPEDPEEERGPGRLLGHLACNWGPLQSTLVYEIENVEIEVDEQLVETSRLIFVRTTDQAAADAFHARAREDRGEDCEDAILELLADGESHPSREIKTAAMSELGVSERTVERAAKRIADRGELAIHARGSSAGPGHVRRGTEWQLISRDRPIAVRVATEGNGAAEPKQRAPETQSRHEDDGDLRDATDVATDGAALDNGRKPPVDEEWFRSLVEPCDLDDLLGGGS